MTIAVDFDGTIVENRYPEIGDERMFATETLKMLEDIDFPQELIVNANEETLKAYFKEKNIYY